MKWSILICLLFTTAFAIDAVEFIMDGPIHEAYVTQEDGAEILQAAPIQPPPLITEQIPARYDTQTQWIPGYWAWSRKRGDFIWVSGVWRKTPPGQIWTPGRWVQNEEGWVWLKGFWSPDYESDFAYLSVAPPDQLDEKVPGKPGKDYFWARGYWEFDETSQDYIWHRGRWTLINEHWQLVPAHYEWRERGYVYVPSFWDYPIDKRGSCYAGAYIEPSQRAIVVYEPSVVLQPLFIVEYLFPDWPSYSSLFYHHFFYHKDVWISWGAAPPWWHWDLWWSFAWQDSWWLWWWWTHPGFPHPFFLEAEMAQQMSPPPEFLLKLMQKARAPAIIADNGVVGSQTLIDAIQLVTGHASPILPADPKLVNQIQEVAYPKEPGLASIRPSGKGIKDVSSKPFFGPTATWLNHPPQNAFVPPYPKVDLSEVEKPKVHLIKPKRPPTYRDPPPVFTSPSSSTQSSYSREYQRGGGQTQFQTNFPAKPYYPEDRTPYYQDSPVITLPSQPTPKSPPSSKRTYKPDIPNFKNGKSTTPIQGSPREPAKYAPLHSSSGSK